ncbi:MAG: hypothetical protein D3923_16240 [Candidatus Electrothrix sp. AR3]|nr:hypothetical protein [Candidatus Electrothrix sp. AR3]
MPLFVTAGLRCDREKFFKKGGLRNVIRMPAEELKIIVILDTVQLAQLIFFYKYISLTTFLPTTAIKYI